MTGLVVDFKPGSQIAKEEKEKGEKAENDLITESVQTNLASHIRKVWETNRWAKQEVYRRLLACLRARKGEYSDSERSAITSMGGADPIFLKLTGTKCRAAAAWVRDILLPVKDRPWELDPTPIPELPEDVKEATMQSIMVQMQQMAQQDGMQLSPDQQIQFTDMVKGKVLEQLTGLAELAIKNIERKIEDKMVDGQYKKAMEEFIEDFVTYPFAVLKGPYYQTKTYLEWKGGKPVPTLQNLLCWRRVSPFDLYYSPYACSTQDGDLIERLRYSRQHLWELRGKKGYNDAEIDKVLETQDNGGLKDWIWEDYERDLLEKNSQLMLSDDDTIDGLHFWGYVRGQDLIDWGYKDKELEPLKMYPIDAILIGRNVIRAVINDNPMGHRPYHSACWDAIPGSLVGVALPEQMEDHQKMVNATARALATNMSIGSGPQVSVLVDMMAPGEEITSIYPMKIWQMRSSITGNSGEPVKFFQPEIKSQELLAVLNQFEQKADDVTNVPRYSYGNEKIGGAGSTATGLSMLMNSAAKGIRRAIANIDLNVIQNTVYQTFIELMMNDPDPTIRGDVKVIARGSAAVLIKEQTQENQKEFLQMTSNPFDIEIMGKKGRARLLANIADNLNLDPLIMPTDEELDLREQQEREMMQKQQEAEIAASQGQGGPDQAAAQQQAMQLQAAQQELQMTQMQMDQKVKEVDQIQKAAVAKEKMAEKQAAELAAESKKVKQMQKQVEEALASLALEKINQDREKAQTLADIEKAQIALEMEAEKLKALATKTKLISATKEEETEKEGKESEKKEAAAASKEVTAAIGKALEQVADALKSSKEPKKISIERDEKGKIKGATLTPTKVE